MALNALHSSKILNLEIAPLFISVGDLCEFAMLPDVHILLPPQGRRGALFFLKGQIHAFGSTFIKKI